jgi:hypothetical protein
VAVTTLIVIGLFVAAVYWLRRTDREIRVPLYVTGAAALVFALYFGVRENGGYLYFKDVAFLGPLVVTAAVAGLVAIISRHGLRTNKGAATVAALGALFLAFVLNTEEEIGNTFDQLPPTTVELRDWARALPADASVRIDLPPGGHQLWALYFLHERRVSALDPLQDAGYPNPPRSVKADYVLSRTTDGRPRGAAGAAVRRNARLTLYRLRPTLPGRDQSAFELEQPKFKAGLD